MIPPPLRAALAGATMTIAGTVISCSLAICVEGAANKTFYYFFPQWYKDVQQAYGLDLHLRRPIASSNNISHRVETRTSQYDYHFIPDGTKYMATSPAATPKQEEDDVEKIATWSC